MKKPVVAICMPHHSHPKMQFTLSLRALRKPGTISGAFPGATHMLDDPRGVAVETARTTLTEHALAAEPQVTHLLWIDDDMVFPPEALERLLAHDLPIVGGLCHGRRGPGYSPVLGRLNDPVWGFAPGAIGWLYDYPKGLVEVDATGGAFLLVKREVFDSISARFGTGLWWEPGWPQKFYSEDFAFCARARECGYKVVVDTTLEIGHVAEVVITSDTARKLRTVEWNAWRDPALQAHARAGRPQASIVIPTYNTPPALLKAAVHSALAQTALVEVIVVDDGTTDYLLTTKDVEGLTEEQRAQREAWMGMPVVELPPGVRLYGHARNRGISAALNTGIANMGTPWFCWLSADDLLDPRKVERQLAATVDGRARASFHRYEVIYPARGDAFPRYSISPPAWATFAEQQAALAQSCVINGSTVMIHRNLLAEVGPFDETLRYSQDWDMWCRIGQVAWWFFVDEILGTRREGGNLTERLEQAAADDPEKQRRDAEDARIRRMYAVPGAAS